MTQYKNNDTLLGKLPPQAIELEEVVLGAILLDKEAYHTANSLITSDSFYKESHQLIYKAISDLVNSSQPVDMLTVGAKLRKDGNLELIGGNYHLMTLVDRVSSSANIETHAALIQQCYLAREAIKVCQDTINKAYDGSTDVFELYDDNQAQMNRLIERNIGRSSVELNDIIAERVKHYEIKSVEGLTGITSGFRNVDRITAGWQQSDLTILAGRPGMGKTAFALSLARHAAVQGNVPVAIFSLEMSKEQLTDRLIAAETGIPQDKLKRRNLSDDDFQKIHQMSDLFNSSIHIDDTPSLSIDAFRTRCMRLKRKHNIGMIVVDYLQLMKGDKENRKVREQEISSISQGLKAVAKELNIPVLALSQLSRAVESRPGAGKRPMLSDLRESGSIEQDADQVIFLFRPEYYGITEDESGNNLNGVAEVIFAKNRNGDLDTVVLNFDGAIMKWSDYETIGF